MKLSVFAHSPIKEVYHLQLIIDPSSAECQLRNWANRYWRVGDQPDIEEIFSKISKGERNFEVVHPSSDSIKIRISEETDG